MATTFIKKAHNGFVFFYNNKATKWIMTIKSQVPQKKRKYLSDHYIVIYKDEKNMDRCFYRGDELSFINNKNNIPQYISNIVTDIMTDGNINKHLADRVVVNIFTKAGASGKYIRPSNI